MKDIESNSDMEKSKSTFITKKTQILILVFCILSGIVFILFHQFLLAQKEGEYSILPSFFGNDRPASPSPSEIIDYFKWSSESTCKKKVYFGGPLLKQPHHKLTLLEGQKAVCLDEKVTPEIDNCLVYSFGDRDHYFEESMAEQQGCRVYSFGHSADKGHRDHSKKIRFYPIALGSEDKAESENEPLETKTLSSIYKMLSALHGADATIDYLKINPVEDLTVLTQIIDSGILKRVRQLSLTIIVLSEDKENQRYLKDIAQVLQRIGNEGEMVRFSSRVDFYSNRKSDGEATSYSAYELVWFNFGKLYGERLHSKIAPPNISTSKSSDGDEVEKPSEENRLNPIDDA